jgi:hypothetical protein
MSTIKNEKVAKFFADNVFFIIHVEKSSAKNNGFADIS